MTKYKKQLKIIVPAGVLCLGLLIWLCIVVFAGSGSPVPVEYVSIITDLDIGVKSRFSGVVEPEERLELSLEPTRTLQERSVEVGDSVKKGQTLFTYDASLLQLTLEQVQLDIERMDNIITTTQEQVDILIAERDNLEESSDAYLDYTTQIKSYETQIKIDEYNKKLKNLEAERLQKEIDASTVTSTIDGTVLSINEPMAADPYYYYESASLPYMVILGNSGYRIRGNVSEQHVEQIAAEAPVKIQSRIYENDTWTGVVDYVDIENPGNTGEEAYYGLFASEPLRASQYPFYITLDDAEGLMLGQHVYIEPAIVTDERDGIWLLENYILDRDKENPYVWAVGEHDTLEKRFVTLGEYDEADNCYEITSGLAHDDEIAWPEKGLRTGRSVIRGEFNGLLQAPLEKENPEETNTPESDDASDPDASTAPKKESKDKKDSEKDAEKDPENSEQPSSKTTKKKTENKQEEEETQTKKAASGSDIPDDVENDRPSSASDVSSSYLHSKYYLGQEGM